MFVIENMPLTIAKRSELREVFRERLTRAQRLFRTNQSQLNAHGSRFMKKAIFAMYVDLRDLEKSGS